MDSETTLNGDYWGAIADDGSEVVFPSPANLPEWRSEIAAWTGDTDTVLEIGPGKAELAASIITARPSLAKYYVVDISQDILEAARRKLGHLEGTTAAQYVQADLNDPGALSGIVPGSVERALMVNVIGYLNLPVAIPALGRILKPGGQLRFTMIDYDFFTKSEDYDPAIDRHYVRGRNRQEVAGLRPVGYTVADNGHLVPYYGFRRAYTVDEIRDRFTARGFTVDQAKIVLLPKDVWRKFQSAQQRQPNPREEQAVEQLGGRPTWDIIVRKK